MKKHLYRAIFRDEGHEENRLIVVKDRNPLLVFEIVQKHFPDSEEIDRLEYLAEVLCD